MYKLFFLLVILHVFSSCSYRISPYFEATTYKTNFQIEVQNNKVDLLFDSPADIIYTRSKKALKKILRQQNFHFANEVLLQGKTDFPPYQYFITIGEQEEQELPVNAIIVDTLLNNLSVHFVGIPLAAKAERALEADLKNMILSMRVKKLMQQ